jgi:hypothetical protein
MTPIPFSVVHFSRHPNTMPRLDLSSEKSLLQGDHIIEEERGLNSVGWYVIEGLQNNYFNVKRI